MKRLIIGPVPLWDNYLRTWSWNNASQFENNSPIFILMHKHLYVSFHKWYPPSPSFQFHLLACITVQLRFTDGNSAVKIRKYKTRLPEIIRSPILGSALCLVILSGKAPNGRITQDILRSVFSIGPKVLQGRMAGFTMTAALNTSESPPTPIPKSTIRLKQTNGQ